MRACSPRPAGRLAAAAILTVAGCATAGAQGPGAADPLVAACYDGLLPQRAEPEDLHVFDSFIGRFRTPDFTDDDTGAQFHYVLENAWVDDAQTTISSAIILVVPSQEREDALNSAFYGHDPFNQILYVHSVFFGAPTGFGSVGLFDAEAGMRETWGCQMDADGVVTRVRDRLEAIDADTIMNVTRMRRGDEPEWSVVSELEMTRLADG